MAGFDDDLALLGKVGGVICAWPVPQVREVMRRLPTEPVPGAPPFVRGLAIVRGAPIPVVDIALLLGEAVSDPAYFVTAAWNDGAVALAVDGLLGVRRLPHASLRTLPPLLGGADHEFVSQIGALDDRLLFVLDSARIVPNDAWVLRAPEVAAT